MNHRRTANEFFSEEEKRTIEATTRDVESRTIGEVVVMVVESSDPYVEAEILGGVLLGSLPAFVLTLLFFHSSVWSFVPMSFIFFFPSQWIVRKLIPLKALFVSTGRKEHAARRRAISAFYEHRLYKTRKNTGVLFLLSLLERKVWVLADTGIHEKIGQESLDQFALIVSQGIRDGRPCEALCGAIQKIGELLSKHFPMTPGDTNELPDELITDEGSS
jgi:putative membrane protein